MEGRSRLVVNWDDPQYIMKRVRVFTAVLCLDCGLGPGLAVQDSVLVAAVTLVDISMQEKFYTVR